MARENVVLDEPNVVALLIISSKRHREPEKCLSQTLDLRRCSWGSGVWGMSHHVCHGAPQQPHCSPLPPPKSARRTTFLASTQTHAPLCSYRRVLLMSSRLGPVCLYALRPAHPSSSPNGEPQHEIRNDSSCTTRTVSSSNWPHLVRVMVLVCIEARNVRFPLLRGQPNSDGITDRTVFMSSSLLRHFVAHNFPLWTIDSFVGYSPS